MRLVPLMPNTEPDYMGRLSLGSGLEFGFTVVNREPPTIPAIGSIGLLELLLAALALASLGVEIMFMSRKDE